MAGRKRKPRPGESFVSPDAASTPAEFFPRVAAGPPPVVGRVVRRRGADDNHVLTRWGHNLPGTGAEIDLRHGAD